MKNYLALITRKRALIIVVFVLIIGGIVSSSISKEDEEKAEEPKTKTVEIETIQKQDTVTTDLIVSGTAVPREFSNIRSLTQGTIEFLVPVGVDVVRGQSLFSIRDANVESAYFTALEQLNSTQASTDQRVIQAELGVTNKMASHLFAEKSLAITKEQADQNLIFTENSSLSTYNSSKASIEQILISLSSSTINGNARYVYQDVLTKDFRVRADTISQFQVAITNYSKLPKTVTKDSIDSDLNLLHEALVQVRGLLDLNGVVLKSAIPAEQYAAELIVNTANQSVVNTAIGSVITNSNSLNSTFINNNFNIQRDENRLELAKIELDNAKVTLESTKASTATENSSTQSRFDIAAYNFSNLTLASPFSGTVLAHNVNVGEQISIGQELIEVGNLDIIEIRVDIDAAFANALKVRDSVVINDDVPGFIAEIEPVADIRSGKVGIIVQSREGVLTSGDIAQVLFDLIFDTPDSIIIPIKAASIEEVKTIVFVENDGKAKERIITLGEIFGDKVRATSGLSEGDRLIIPNGTFISEDDNVVERVK